MDELEIEGEVVLLGSSMGGAIATMLAEIDRTTKKYLDRI
jgi:pimeloyl-ACP methyl ester carboxylesterase